MPITITEIPFGSALYKQVCGIRNEVLRKPIGMELREKDVELDHTEHHIAAFDGERMIGCVLLRPLEAGVVKLRQMAVVDGYQGKGVGAQLVRFAEGLAVREGFTSVETNARKTAQGFYVKLGYRPVGEEFIEVSLHTIKMQKLL